LSIHTKHQQQQKQGEERSVLLPPNLQMLTVRCQACLPIIKPENKHKNSMVRYCRVDRPYLYKIGILISNHATLFSLFIIFFLQYGHFPAVSSHSITQSEWKICPQACLPKFNSSTTFHMIHYRVDRPYLHKMGILMSSHGTLFLLFIMFFVQYGHFPPVFSHLITQFEWKIWPHRRRIQILSSSSYAVRHTEQSSWKYLSFACAHKTHSQDEDRRDHKKTTDTLECSVLLKGTILCFLRTTICSPYLTACLYGNDGSIYSNPNSNNKCALHSTKFWVKFGQYAHNNDRKWSTNKNNNRKTS